MASEIRVDKINSLSGVGTVTLSPTGVDIAGITTAATLRATTGIVTSLTAGSLTSLGAVSGTTGTFSAAVSGTTGTFTGDVDIADTIVHTGDTNTKIRFPAADTITAETGGSERVRIGSGGDVSVGGHATNYADSPLEVRGTNAGGDVAIRVTNNSTTAGTQAGVIFTTTTSDFTTAGIGYERGGSADALRFYVGQSAAAGGFDNATERLRVRSDGNVDINGTPPWSVSGGDYRSLSISGEGASASGFIYMGNGAAVENADFDVGRINFCNGSNIIARLLATTDSSDDDEGRVSIYTKKTGQSESEKLRIDSDGNVNVKTGNLIIGTSGKGIDFSITSDASGMTSELLDDYEEGSWTPNIRNDGTTSTWNSQQGRYVKIGQQVTVWFNADGGTSPRSGGTSSSLIMTGLPFSQVMFGNPILGSVGANKSSGSGLYSTIGVILSPFGQGGTQVRFGAGGQAINFGIDYVAGCFTYTAS